MRLWDADEVAVPTISTSNALRRMNLRGELTGTDANGVRSATDRETTWYGITAGADQLANLPAQEVS